MKVRFIFLYSFRKQTPHKQSSSVLQLWDYLSCFCMRIWSSNHFQQRNGVYTVGDFMTRRESLHVVKPATSVDEGKVIIIIEEACYAKPNVNCISSDVHFVGINSFGTSRGKADYWLSCDWWWLEFGKYINLHTYTFHLCYGMIVSSREYFVSCLNLSYVEIIFIQYYIMLCLSDSIFLLLFIFYFLGGSCQVQLQCCLVNTIGNWLNFPCFWRVSRTREATQIPDPKRLFLGVEKLFHPSGYIIL